MQIKSIPLEKIIPYQNNPRDNGPAVNAVASSIREFGFSVPILLDKNYTIIAGHTRLYAARKLGLSEAPCIVAENLDEAKVKALRIADNKVAELSSWDKSVLGDELKAIGEAVGMDEFGFDFDDLLRVFDEDLEEKAKDLPEPKTKRGDVYVLGEHRLMCGDSTSEEDVKKLMAGERAQMCFTDPPYNVAYTGGTKDKLRIMNDNLGYEFPQFVLMSMQQILLNTDGAIYVCMSSSELDTLIEKFVQAGGRFGHFVMWEKNKFCLGRSDYQRQYEPILYGWPAGSKRPKERNGGVPMIWNVDKPVANRVHPTMKPVELVKKAVLVSSAKGDVVLDLFGGSGTTMVACEKTGRKSRLMELDPRYCDVIVSRWEELTGMEARLE